MACIVFVIFTFQNSLNCYFRFYKRTSFRQSEAIRDLFNVEIYEGHPINKLLNSVILLIFRI